MSAKRRADYAGRAEDNAVRVNIRLTPSEESQLEAKAEIAGILPRAGSLTRRNLSEAARKAIEAWQPQPAQREPAPAPSRGKLRRVTVQG